MASRYRVEYALKQHRKDNFIEWIKGLLAVPFVLQAGKPSQKEITKEKEQETLERYARILKDVEHLIESHIEQTAKGQQYSQLKMLVPTITSFWTPLPLVEALYDLEPKLCLAKRSFVAPSFNDVRTILGGAQLRYLAQNCLEMVSFDGDVTLYEDGQPLLPDNPVISRLVQLLSKDIYVVILTAAGYPSRSGKEYMDRFSGLLQAIEDTDLTDDQKRRLHVLGGESNYLFEYNPLHGLQWIESESWMLPIMKTWPADEISEILDSAETALRSCINALNIDARIIRKERSVGFVPSLGQRLRREQLEETVLEVQTTLQLRDFSVPFTAFNGGNDIWCDIGDKKLGVRCLQYFFAISHPSKCLHVGDQFLSAGNNDYKARSAATTVWVSSPSETVEFLDYYFSHLPYQP
ncbi:IMP 5'-nucleotidase [Schizosaccharomyces cryophilus OY26]|uniref:IMP-specific 5'-nucleotidase 1 n=1 Tax=Schizosaccharomyces cryophilus (strain OY26 / ATCC MYA-4695 / CBS 11777 / NBRC 106824 / NRRL Y48691) TaxID=653667 RepID=S9W1S2_SCHCR|nr:IMP 5'-nucleotidase [Schizosaccharomyces cryophilus OY26]EPY53988.1 IMP 5'-nucleotidase [Schizosaccharomyces cryophilus OY26]